MWEGREWRQGAREKPPREDAAVHGRREKKRAQTACEMSARLAPLALRGAEVGSVRAFPRWCAAAPLGCWNRVVRTGMAVLGANDIDSLIDEHAFRTWFPGSDGKDLRTVAPRRCLRRSSRRRSWTDPSSRLLRKSWGGNTGLLELL